MLEELGGVVGEFTIVTQEMQKLCERWVTLSLRKADLENKGEELKRELKEVCQVGLYGILTCFVRLTRRSMRQRSKRIC